MKKKEHDRLETLLKSKPFQELNEADQHWVRDQVGGENAYEHLRGMIMDLGRETTLKVSSKIRQELVAEFRRKHQTA